MLPSRTRTYLWLALTGWASGLRPAHMHLSESFSIRMTGIRGSVISVVVEDPTDGRHFFTITLREHKR